MTRLSLLCSMSMLLSSFVPSLAQAADPTGPEILLKVDKALNAFTDGTWESKLLVKTPDGQSREFGFVTYQKNPDKRLVRFTSPGDVKGMGVLVENRETMYVFLPGFQRVRRMGTHIKNQTFMGSDFSFEDMSQTTFGAIYEAKLVGQDDASYQLELSQKPGMDLEFPKVKISISKTTYAPLKMEYFDLAGKKLKTQIREDYKKDSGEHWNPGRIVITDHRRNDHTSEIQFTSTKLNTGLSDDLFTQRSLIRGN
jgi:outer membrane lipoprotein-sorting protein